MYIVVSVQCVTVLMRLSIAERALVAKEVVLVPYLLKSYHDYLIFKLLPIFGLTQECLREVWNPRQGICLFTPCVGYFTSPGIDTR